MGATHDQITTDIAIVGAGFSGTATAINLMYWAKTPLKVTLLESCPAMRFGGLAYSESTTHPDNRTNIAANHMSIFPHKPYDVLEWLGERTEVRLGEAISRRDYGRYLKARFQETQKAKAGIVTTTSLDGRAVDLIPDEDTPTLVLADGRTISAKDIVLTTGHVQPASASFITPELARDKRVLLDQYAGRTFETEAGGATPDDLYKLPADKDVFIIGSGTSAYDAAVVLLNKGHQGKIIMFSRHGYRPKTRRKDEDIGPFVKPPFPKGATSEEVCSVAAKEYIGMRRPGVTSEQILAGMESGIPHVIGNLDREVVRDVLQRFKSRISTLRVGMEPQTGRQIDAAIRDGKIMLWAGDIHRMETQEDGIIVHYTPRKEEKQKTLQVDFVVSALGQETDYTKLRDPLWRNLLRKEVATPHFTGMGVQVGDHGELVDAQEKPSTNIYMVGPMRQGDAMVRARNALDSGCSYRIRLGPVAASVSELSGQAHSIAHTLLEKRNIAREI